MTDSHLRDLERRFRASGSVEDEAAWLRARVQAGELSQERLELASALGHRGSELASGTASVPTSEALSRLGKGAEARARAACALGHAARPHWKPQAIDYDPGDPDEGLRALEEWIVYQNDETTGRLVEAIGHSDDLWCLLALCVDGSPANGRERFLSDMHGFAKRLVDREAELSGALREALAPWLLGYSDPVRERVQTRQREAAGE